MPLSVRRLLFGRDAFAAVAAPLVGLLAGGAIWIAYPSVAASYALVPDDALGWLVLVALVAVPALVAWWNDGLFVCWLLEFGPLFAIYLARVESPPPADGYAELYTVLALAAVGAAIWGTIGFVAGLGLRRTAGGVRTRWLRRARP